MTSVPAFEHRTDPDPNAKTANAITMSFPPFIDIPRVVSAIEPTSDCEVAEKVISI